MRLPATASRRPILKNVDRVANRVQPGSPAVAYLDAMEARALVTSLLDRPNQAGWRGPLAIADEYNVGPPPLVLLQSGDDLRHDACRVGATAERGAEE